MDTIELWTGYVKIVAPLMMAYYGFVMYKFYRQELKAFWAGMGGRAPTVDVVTVASRESTHTASDEGPGGVQQNLQEEEEEPEFRQSEEAFRKVEDLAAHLKAAIGEAHEKNYSRQELVLLLQMTLRESNIGGTPFQYAINNLVENECSKYGHIHLRAEDLAEMWDQVG